jgi:hypothetical protein
VGNYQNFKGGLKMDENANEGDDLVIGVDAIVALAKQEFSTLCFYWKPEFAFPIEKRNGQPTISRAALAAWIRDIAGGQPLEKITTPLLYKLHYRRELESMETREIKGMETICRLVRLPPEQIRRWVKEYDTPIRKLGPGDAGFAVDVRSLLIWMSDMGIRRGNYISPRVQITNSDPA